MVGVELVDICRQLASGHFATYLFMSTFRFMTFIFRFQILRISSASSEKKRPFPVSYSGKSWFLSKLFYRVLPICFVKSRKIRPNIRPNQRAQIEDPACAENGPAPVNFRGIDGRVMAGFRGVVDVVDVVDVEVGDIFKLGFSQCFFSAQAWRTH